MSDRPRNSYVSARIKRTPEKTEGLMEDDSRGQLEQRIASNSTADH